MSAPMRIELGDVGVAVRAVDVLGDDGDAVATVSSVSRNGL